MTPLRSASRIAWASSCWTNEGFSIIAFILIFFLVVVTEFGRLLLPTVCNLKFVGQVYQKEWPWKARLSTTRSHLIQVTSPTFPLVNQQGSWLARGPWHVWLPGPAGARSRCPLITDQRLVAATTVYSRLFLSLYTVFVVKRWRESRRMGWFQWVGREDRH